MFFLYSLFVFQEQRRLLERPDQGQSTNEEQRSRNKPSTWRYSILQLTNHGAFDYPLYKVSLLESVSGVSRSDVVMNPLIFLLTLYRLSHSFYINLESDYTNNNVWKAKLDSRRR